MKHLSVLSLLLSLLIFAVVSQDIQAQTYPTQNRPANLNWKVLSSEYFRIIYPEGEEMSALSTAKILEDQYPIIVELTGGKLKNFPFILNNYNDISNGFVTPFNFRSEIFLAPFKGKNISAESGNWLEAVVPHELVHAVHGNVNNGASIGGLLRILSPDFARSINFFPPVGMHEGLAVYHESEGVVDGGGRGNYSFFNNQFNANFFGRNRWSMGQTFHTSDYSIPFDRHYISGYTFVNWLHNNYGEDVSKKAISTHYNWFFFGYGFALRQATGKWPHQLYKEYETDLEERRTNIFAENELEEKAVSYIELPFKGKEVRRPIWISDSEILFYGNFYNSYRGFHVLNVNSNKVKRVFEHLAVQDFIYDFDADSEELVFSRYFNDIIYPSATKAEILVLDTESYKASNLTSLDRTYSPTKIEDGYLALQTNSINADIVKIEKDKSISVLKEFEEFTPVSLTANPANREQIAVIINKKGLQALWLTNVENLNSDLDGEPTLAFESASIHDISWHPEGKKILFTLAAEPMMNIFEYDLNTKEVRQITDSRFNAFEASYSLDGKSIVYVEQKDGEREIALLNEADFNNSMLEEGFISGIAYEEKINRKNTVQDISELEDDWEVSDYGKDFSWLKPRGILPVVRENSGTNQVGVYLASVDALSSQAYDLELTGIQSRLWYNFSYTNRTFYPGLRFSAFSEPSFFYNQSLDFSFMQQERGFSLGMPLNFNFRADTRITSFFIEPRLRVEQVKLFDLSPNPLSGFANRYRAGAFSQLNVSLVQNSRDIQPVSGLSFFGLLDQGLNTTELEAVLPNSQVTFGLQEQWAAYYGAFAYVSPLRRLNQSLMLNVRFLKQSESLLYSTSTIVPIAFPATAFPSFFGNGQSNNNLGRFSTKYTIPLFYPDNGWLTVPGYLSGIYLSGFTHTLTDFNGVDLQSSARTVVGGGLHFIFKVSNLRFDLGFGVSYEPSRNEAQFLFGEF